MNATRPDDVEALVLELQNDGPVYAKYQPVLEAIINSYHRINRGLGDEGTMVDHCIYQLQIGFRTCFLENPQYETFYKLMRGTGEFKHKVIGGLLEDYYREWKYQNAKVDNVNKCAEIPEPPHHLDRVIAEQHAYYNPKPADKADTIKPKDTAMTIKIESKTFFNGQDIANFTDDQLFGHISQAENEIKKLEAIETKPKKLEKKIADLKEGINALAAAIDAR